MADRQNILLQDFLGQREKQTKQLRQQTEQLAKASQREVQYLPSFCNKEELVQNIRRERGVADNGLIAGRNPVKMYDQFGTVLRVETTLNDMTGLRWFARRPRIPNNQRSDSHGARAWRQSRFDP